MSKKQVILVNNVFVGGYGYDENNLPHEMINFFCSDSNGNDNKNFYVYVTPYGAIDSSLKIQDLKSIIFVRSAGNSLVEVLAKAEIDSNNEDNFFTQGVQICGDKNDAENYKNIKQKKLKERYHNLFDKANITYGGVSLKDIHKENGKDNEVLVTLKVKSICLPKKTFYFTNKKENVEIRPDVIYTGKKKLANQSMKAYFSEDSEGFEILSKVIDKEDYWYDASHTPEYANATSTANKSFFKVIRQQDNEVVFSSVFYHYLFTYKDFRNDFLRTVLEINPISKEYIVEREKDHMDIRLVSSDDFIIIENKIKSGINGLKEDKDNKSFQKNFDGKYFSQLSDYYEIANATNKTVRAFIFTPNYNDAANKDYIKDTFVHGDKYDIITYEKIHNFFVGFKAKYSSTIEFYEDFTNVLAKHISPVDNEHRDVLLNRLANRIASYHNAYSTQNK